MLTLEFQTCYFLKNLVVFASGSGSNFQSIIDAIKDGSLNATITGFITNKAEAYSLERAKKNDIPNVVINPNNFDSEPEYVSTLISQLQDWNADLLILAGYLKKIPSEVINKYDQRILNIHPSLLPKFGGKGFYGIKVHEAVIASEDTESGCTVHIVTEEYDKGPILGQSKVSVSSSDTVEDLSKKVLIEEHKLFPDTIQTYLQTLNN